MAAYGVKISWWVIVLDKIINHVIKGNYLNRINEHLTNFGYFTKIHGIHYFTNKERSSKERYISIYLHCMCLLIALCAIQS